MNLGDTGTMVITHWNPHPSLSLPSSLCEGMSLGRYGTLQMVLYLSLTILFFSSNHPCVPVQFTVKNPKTLSACPRGPCPYLRHLETQTLITLQIVCKMTNFFPLSMSYIQLGSFKCRMLNLIRTCVPIPTHPQGFLFLEYKYL